MSLDTDIAHGMVCPYCVTGSSTATGKDVYPHRPDLASKNFRICWPCAAWVGCHDDGRPMGRLANAELRKAKQEAHLAFDVLWEKRGMSRKAAYNFLAARLGIDAKGCHIGMFDIDLCHRVVAICLPLGSFDQ